MVAIRPSVQGPLLLVVAITLVVAELARRRRPRRGATTLAGLMYAAALWNGSLTVVSFSISFQVSWAANVLQYVGIVATVFFFVLFALEFSGKEGWITRKTVALLLVEPVLVVVLAATNSYHHLFWSVVDPARGPLYDGSAFVGTTGYFVHALYSYLALLAGTVLICWKLYRSQSLYRKQAAAILVALGASWLGNALFLFEITDVGHTVGFAVTGIALFLGMFRFGLADVTPVARATVMDELDAGVVVLDRENRLIDVNDEAATLLGIDEDAVIARPMEAVFADYPELVERYREGDRMSEEVEFNAPDGRATYQVRTTPLFDDRDRRIGRVVVFQNITEQKRRERQLESQNEQLEEFASIVSHDLRNPLNVAQGYVDATRETGDLSMLDEIEASHDRMERLIEDMLALARQGQRITETEPVSLAAVAEDAWSAVDTADATLSVETERVVPADRSRLRQVFENLFRNSVEHGSTGSQNAPRSGDSVEHGSTGSQKSETSGDSVEHASSDVAIRVGNVGDDRGLIEDQYGFYVEDDGPGIPEDRREKVLEAGHTTNPEGTGFGLSIVTSIVEAHGWSLAVAESPEGGARFEVTGVGTASESVGDGAEEALPDASREGPKEESATAGITDD